MPDCPQCGHRWDEHAGGGADDEVAAQLACGECEYEVEHGFLPADGPLCHLRAFHTRVQVLLSDVCGELERTGAAVTWVSPSPHWRTARVELDLPGGRDVVVAEDDGGVHVVADHHAEHVLDDDQEAPFVRDPLAFLTALAGPGAAGDPRGRRPVVARMLEDHLAAPFPAHLRGEEVAGVDAVMLDADIVGCVSTWLSSGERLPAGGERLLRRLTAEVEAVLAELHEPADRDYYRRLRAMARAVHP